ncbi:MAG: UDP-N-acetylglucosamine 2-epimerase (non-hydrolyzing) [Actinobacteria bacterium]|nr:UDP-N-acetylglucosamine 2-epimerase (non-hydrolyzing) [Actinomycetota bacterium]MBU1942230.1 UDP-N-acetylglucosamine 2-epimerase (non-hydrolyzing) [Actinomycetota bacterium]MBU2687421.1 UDP-N-acetylglucosamine 2-epimerase (non-hydrolyzing) [Actinomycetota bacterium]
MTSRIIYVVGTRPEIIRSAGVIEAMSADPDIDLTVVHSGQHYDYLMDRVFFEGLGVPYPEVNLDVGSGSAARQTAGILESFEGVLERLHPGLVAVFGDTNSSLATALCAARFPVPVAHLEAGCREWELDVPEEINRRLIDHCSRLLLAVSPGCVANLEAEHAPGDVFNTGDPLYGVYLEHFDRERASGTIAGMDLEIGGYAVLTVHRQGNVDDPERLLDILSTLERSGVLFVLPVHPRTSRVLEDAGYRPGAGLRLIEPLDYEGMLDLLSGAVLAVTDSGGLQKEAFWSGVPCVTLREHTAWHETVELGANFLAGRRSERLAEAVEHVLAHRDEIASRIEGADNPYYRPDTTAETVRLLKEYAGKPWD